MEKIRFPHGALELRKEIGQRLLIVPHVGTIEGTTAALIAVSFKAKKTIVGEAHTNIGLECRSLA